MTRPEKWVPRCNIQGCRLARGHLGERHDSTPLGRAIAHAPTMLTTWKQPEGMVGFHLVEFMTPAGPVRGEDVTAEFVRMFDPRAQQ